MREGEVERKKDKDWRLIEVKPISVLDADKSEFYVCFSLKSKSSTLKFYKRSKPSSFILFFSGFRCLFVFWIRITYTHIHTYTWYLYSWTFEIVVMALYVGKKSHWSNICENEIENLDITEIVLTGLRGGGGLSHRACFACKCMQ